MIDRAYRTAPPAHFSGGHSRPPIVSMEENRRPHGTGFAIAIAVGAVTIAAVFYLAGVFA